MVVIMKFKEFLENNQNARKIFGKKELEIIKKQLEGTTLKQSEKNRLSVNIKPKLRFIEQASNYKDEFSLSKNQDNKNLIKNAINYILKDELKENISAILLFGSFADKTQTPMSDIDLGIIFKKEISSKESTLFRMRLLGEVSKKIDLQIVNTLPSKIRKSIARKHKVLYKTKDFDNISFTINELKDQDFNMRLQKIFEASTWKE